MFGDVLWHSVTHKKVYSESRVNIPLTTAVPSNMVITAQIQNDIFTIINHLFNSHVCWPLYLTTKNSWSSKKLLVYVNSDISNFRKEITRVQNSAAINTQNGSYQKILIRINIDNFLLFAHMIQVFESFLTAFLTRS